MIGLTLEFDNHGGKDVQVTLNQLDKKGDKEKIDIQVAEFFYISLIPFNAIRNPTFVKMCEMIERYGVDYKHPSYHDAEEKLLKQVVEKIDILLQEYNDEWKKISCTIMSYGYTNNNKHSICNFVVNNKGIVLFYSLNTLNI